MLEKEVMEERRKSEVLQEENLTMKLSLESNKTQAYEQQRYQEQPPSNSRESCETDDMLLMLNSPPTPPTFQTSRKRRNTLVAKDRRMSTMFFTSNFSETDESNENMDVESDSPIKLSKDL